LAAGIEPVTRFYRQIGFIADDLMLQTEEINVRNSALAPRSTFTRCRTR